MKLAQVGGHETTNKNEFRSVNSLSSTLIIPHLIILSSFLNVITF